MKNVDFNLLLQEILSDDSFVFSERLDEHWDTLFKANPQHKQELMTVKKIIENIRVKEPEKTDESIALLWAKIETEISVKKHKKEKRKFILTLTTSAAAAILILVGTLSYFKSSEAGNIDYSSMVANLEIQNQDSDVRLIVPGEEDVNFKSSNAILSYNKEGDLELDNEDKSNKRSTESKIALNTLIVPHGRTSQLTLADGTIIWVNSGTKVVYPSVFANNMREIYVEGEAFLNVAKKDGLPFVVKTGKMDVKVLGTSFNVSSFMDEREVSVVLATGSVTISRTGVKQGINLTPNQKFTYDREAEISNVTTVDAADYSCWINGYLQLKSQKVDLVLNKLERHFNIPIEYDQSKIGVLTLSGKLDLTQDLEDILRSIAVATTIEYKKENGIVKVTIKK